MYNNLGSDCRLNKVLKEEALNIIKTFEDEWVFIKLIVYKKQDYSMRDYITNYYQAKVLNINIYKDFLTISGYKKGEILRFNTNDIIQTESSFKNDELLIILEENKSNYRTDIYIKKHKPNKQVLIDSIMEINQNLIITEGKTDWKHLKSAWEDFKNENKYKDLDFKFFEYEETLGNNKYNEKYKGGCDTLSKICNYVSNVNNEKLRIFVFDADNEKINKEYMDKNKRFKYLGNNVYAFTIPIPKNREDTKLISIENYYSDEDIKTQDIQGKRLYLSSEFFENNNIYSKNKDEKRPNLIIDSEVFEISPNLKAYDEKVLKKLILSKDEKVKKIKTLSKNDFAENILNRVHPFDEVCKDNFRLIFDIIKDIFENYNDMSKENKLEIDNMQSDLEEISTEELMKIIKNIKNKDINVSLNIIKNNQSYIRSGYKFKVLDFDKYRNLIYLYSFNEQKIIISIDEKQKIEKNIKNTYENFEITLKNKEYITKIYIEAEPSNLDNITDNDDILIITENEWDWKHLKSAWKDFKNEDLYQNIEFDFLEYEYNLNSKIDIGSLCEFVSIFDNKNLRIFVFDRDDIKINDKYSSNDEYKYIGNNVYVIILPNPKGENNNGLITIENYYSDEDLKTQDNMGKRLYLNNEFSFNEEKTLYSLKFDENNPNLIVTDQVFEFKKPLIIKDKEELNKRVYEDDTIEYSNKEPLSKIEFANNILNKIKPFDKVIKDNFRAFFDIVKKIILNSNKSLINEKLGLENIIPINVKSENLKVYIERYKGHSELHIERNLLKNEGHIYGPLLMSIYINNMDIIIEIQNYTINIPVCMEMLRFIMDKIDSSDNRIYFYTCKNKEYVIYEIFKDETSVILLEKLLTKLNRQ